ncbi:hypothetical protein BCR35DRAFT_127006 [Leucosporidium creatinivorum]|uniref:Uncharacterized protein n=1 Tax=Leucosporidium creatinivorum TaxID=106004 RepID=A0A1Y2EVQ9_9BASI|nr:hypothetical protein BCR35DRAFT_127006 [Leucosporidium creatinivorum]
MASSTDSWRGLRSERPSSSSMLLVGAHQKRRRPRACYYQSAKICEKVGKSGATRLSATASSAPTLPFAEAPSKASSATQDSARRQQPRLWSSRRFNPLESSTTADPSPALRRPPLHLDSHRPLRLLRRDLGSCRSTSLEAWRPL